jgi:DNA-binding transcriptional LysR family regulator
LPISHSLVELNTEMLCRARTVAVVPENHPLAAKSAISAEDFPGHPIIALRPNLLWRERIDDFFKAGGIRPHYTMETQSTLIARRLVAEGVGIAVMDKIVGGSAVRDGVIEIPLVPERWVSYCYVFPAGQQLQENAAHLIRAVRSVVDRLARDNSQRGLVKPAAADGAEAPFA